MAKKSRQHTPAKPQQFASSPFTALRGVVVPSKPATVDISIKDMPPVPSEENATDVFLQAMTGTRPLHDATRINTVHVANGNRAPEVRPKARAVASPDEIAASELFKQEIGRLRLEVKFTEQLPDEDELKPLSGNRLKQLKRGIIIVDHQLDLHGLTRDEALAELPRFLRSARLKGQAAALVITGKGHNSPAEPVLQQAVAAWLRDAGRDLVVEYAPAPREMGGSGALVVFLRPASPPDSTPV